MAFEGVLAPEGRKPNLTKRATLTVSVLLHAAALIVGIVYSFWYVEELTPPSLAVTLHIGAVPPPPPPPPPKKSASTKPKTKVADVKRDLVQPKDQPKDEPARADKGEADNDKEDEGVAGGVQGGVIGGVIGGVVGGAVPAALPKNTGPKVLPPQVAKGLLLINPDSEEYRVKLPPALARANLKFAALLKICVSAQGTVTEVKILQPADPAIDPQIPVVIGRWRYRPFTVDGRPEPFCYLVRYEISSR